MIANHKFNDINELFNNMDVIIAHLSNERVYKKHTILLGVDSCILEILIEE